MIEEKTQAWFDKHKKNKYVSISCNGGKWQDVTYEELWNMVTRGEIVLADIPLSLAFSDDG